MKLLPLLFMPLPLFAQQGPPSHTNLAAQPPMASAVSASHKSDAQHSEAIGSYSAGSLKHAVAFPKAGRGFQMIRRRRERYYGHANTLAWLTQFGQALSDAGLRPVLVGDVAKRTGGRVRRDHASHQNGLDIDIWFENPRSFDREGDQDPPSLVYKHRVNNRFGARHLLLLELAARSPQVNRIFVNYAIKRALCDLTVGDRSWLYKIRPWWGHDAHFHVRLSCPKDSPQCISQEPLDPKNETCGDEVEWFASHRKGRRKSK